MCSDSDTPPYDEPIEDSIDWAELRRIREGREAQEVWWRLQGMIGRHVDRYDQTGAFPSERDFGLPPRPGRVAIAADGARHSEARRGGLA